MMWRSDTHRHRFNEITWSCIIFNFSMPPRESVLKYPTVWAGPSQNPWGSPANFEHSPSHERSIDESTDEVKSMWNVPSRSQSGSCYRDFVQRQKRSAFRKKAPLHEANKISNLNSNSKSHWGKFPEINIWEIV